MDAPGNLLRDLVPSLIEKCRDARRKAREAGNSSAADTERARHFAYYEVVNHIVHQIDAFGIPRESVGIAADFDPTRELL